MSRVQRLPDDLVNKIAAGEVVERPASVVKELVENALDAEAGAVSVEIEVGGKRSIRVRDDGSGMSREDAERALERHATSKLRALEDLDQIGTHGFRGEALPSIASVSHLVLRTREDGAEAGTEVEVRHGRRLHVRDAGHPRGTTVEVRDLFGAVPARRKFLRAEATEAAHVAEAVTTLAVARPDVGFTLVSGGRSLVQAPSVDGLAPRIYQVFGGAFLETLLPVEAEEGWVNVRGLVSRPDRPGGSRLTLRLFVNGRPVRDRALAKAVSEAYRAAGAREPRGDAFLFVGVPLHMVDVNVHPAKTEVRFAEPRVVWSAVERAVASALSSGSRSARPAPDFEREGEPLPSPNVAARAAVAGVATVAEPVRAWPDPSPASDPRERAAATALLQSSPPTVLGQHRNTYIVATDGDDILLVDQHTAHERVRFEALLRGRASGAVESQILLVPRVHAVAPRLRPVLDANAGLLKELGFEVEAFGGDTVTVRSMPAVLGPRDPAGALEGLLGDLLEREDAEWAVSGARDRLLATLACHSAARAGQPLGAEAQRAIVAGLWEASQPALCPHGRPTRVRIPREDLTRWFQRTGWRRQ